MASVTKAALIAEDRATLAMPAMLPELMLLRESPSDTSVMAVSILLEPYLEDWRRRPRMATAILKRLAKQGRSRLAATVLSAMAAHGVETNVFHYSALLTACASGGHWPWALALAQRIGCSGMQMDAVGVGTQMRACARSKRWDWPLSLLMDLRSSACQLDVVVYNTCVAHGIWERSWFLLRGIRQNKLEPDLFTFDALSASSWPASVCMLMCTVHEGVQPDVFCYNSVIAEGGVGWEGGLNMVDTMQASGLRPDVATYDASIGLCAGARWQTAFELWNILRTSCRADVVALTAVLGTCADVSKWQASVGFCEGIQTVDLISCNALVHACAKGSMWQDAVFLFDAAPGNRVLPDEATQSSLLASLSAGSCWELALSAFFEWFGKPSARTPLVCSTLLSALSAGWQWLFALELLRIMEKSSVEVSRECQNAAVDAYGRAAQWQGASGLFGSFPGRNSIGLNSALAAKARAAEWRQALALAVLGSFASRSLQRNGISFSSAGHALARCLLWERSLHALKFTKQAGVQPCHAAYNSAACSLEKNHWSKSLSLLKAMGILQVERDDVACSKLLSSCANTAQWRFSLCMVDQMPRNSHVCTDAVYTCAVRSLTSGLRWRDALELRLCSVPSATLFSSFMLDCILHGYMGSGHGHVQLLPFMLSRLESTPFLRSGSPLRQKQGTRLQQCGFGGTARARTCVPTMGC